MKTLAVIPARGGSKGIPRKNMLMLKGRPLIRYCMDNAVQCPAVTDVVVTSDDPEILNYAAEAGLETVLRKSALADDATTLDPVVHDAVVEMETRKGAPYDCVVTLQPTSPLLKPASLTKALELFRQTGCDTVISVVNRPHLTWGKENGKYVPNYRTRANRQSLPPCYYETGAFVVCARDVLSENSRFGDRIELCEIPEDEALDIDGPVDWMTCNAIMGRKRIVFRADGDKQLGMGHIYHCLALAYRLTGHELLFVCDRRYEEGARLIAERHFPCRLVKDDDGFFELLREWKADIVVNDRLNSARDYMLELKGLTPRLVGIEDLGEGARYADVVINALYHPSGQYLPNGYFGKEYICLREEFLLAEPKSFSERVETIFVMFGGSDPCNLTRKVYDLALEMNGDKPLYDFLFVTGIAYDHEANGIVDRKDRGIRIVSNTRTVSRYMKRGDLAITSQGRGAFELASLGVPSIVMAQNSREQMHIFATMGNGFFNLGLGANVSPDTLRATIHYLADAPQLRREMRELMLAGNLKAGVDHVLALVLGDFEGKQATA